MKVTAIAPSNIAFTKYWGKKDEVLRLPENGSICMTLSNLYTITTVDFSDKYKKDEIIINGGRIEEDEKVRVVQYVNRVREIAQERQGAKLLHLEGGISVMRARVVSNNNFPSGTGLAASASGFAALTLAGTAAMGLYLSEKELSILARQGSGSACRSIPSGFVEWLDGETSDTSYAKQIFPPDYWKIADVVVIFSEKRKNVSSTVGQKSARSSPFMGLRVSRMKEKNKLIKKLIKERNFKDFGQLLEAEALEFHAITLTQTPPLIYWLPTTVLIMKLVQNWRRDGLPVYFTIDTGQNVHLIVEQKNVQKVVKKLKNVTQVRDIIINKPGKGAHLINKHLF